MVPNRLVQIPEIPVTINGKVDTRALSKIEISKSLNQSTDLHAPMSEVEIKLVSIWSELLEIPEELIGTQDDFFGLGGDSLQATTLSFMLTKAFGKCVSVAQVFKLKTIEALSQYITNAAEMVTVIEKVNGAQLISLAQERLLFIDELENGTHAFNIQFLLELPASVNKNYVKRAIELILCRHEVLRTLIQDRMQVILPEKEAVEDFSMEFSVVPSKEELDESLDKLSKHVFILEEELPFNVQLFEIEKDKTRLYISFLFHHICFDGWSWLVLQRDLKAFYDNLNGKSLNLPTICNHYKDFATWQRKQLQGNRLKPLLDYWLQNMEGYEPLNLITDFTRPRKFDYSGREIKFELDREVTSNLKSLARQQKVSLYTVLVSAYCLMLRAYTNQNEIVIGTPVSNRNRSELENVVGFFVNLLALRIKIDSESSIGSYVQAVSEEIIKSQIHQELPFDKLVNEMGIETDLSRHPIFQVIFTFDQFSASEVQSDLVYSNYIPANVTETSVKYDLSATMSETEMGLCGTFTYATKLFRSDTVAGYVSTYIIILTQFSKCVGNPELKVLDVNLTEDSQSPPALIGIELTDIWSEGRTLHKIFQNVANSSPNAVALVYENTELSYKELNERSNQFAHYLQSLSNTPLQPDDLVALFLDKSELMIISILGVWKADSAYVPIDPSYPDERIAFILQDTGARTVITNQVYVSRLTRIAKNLTIVPIDCPDTAIKISRMPSTNTKTSSTENSLCYVIYTSGTTGKPKGVMVEHGGLVNFRHGLKSLYPESGQGILLLSNYVFDFSLEQIILSILNSNKLIIPPNEICLDDEFYDDMNRNELSYLSGTPTFIHEMNLSKLEHLQRVTVAGEFFTKSHFDKIRREFSGPVANAYGITETSVYNIINFFKDGDPYKNSLGQMMPNIKGYVLNDQLQQLPNGAVGKLHLAGNCVARGYLNRPKLTAEYFHSNPFHSGDFERMYTSGDLVRCLADGTLEYLGRSDTQVKIHGLRIDLGEIEAVLGSHPQISRCTVIATKQQQIIGYYVKNGTVSEEELRSFLESKLPSYMIPSKLIQIEGKLQMTVNGKLDTKALEQANLPNGKLSLSDPRNNSELQLCRIWAEFLRIGNIGIDDDFFRLGGDSILSMQVARRIRTEMRIKVTVKDIFVQRTVRKLYDNVVSNGEIVKIKPLATEPEIPYGDVPLSAIQNWFFAKRLPNYNHWNQSFTLKTPQLDLSRIKNTINRLVHYHDAFRLRFKKSATTVTQFYDTTKSEVALHSLDITTQQNGSQVAHWLNRWQSCFNIENGPTFCLAYLHGYEDGSARLWFAMHHLIVDSVSWRVIKDDFERVYNGGKLGRKSSSYRSWTRALQNYACTPNEVSHWEDITKSAVIFNQNLKNLIGTNNLFNSTFLLSHEQTASLVRKSVQAYDCGINDLLLTALGYALESVTNDPINYVTLEGHGREEIKLELDVSNTVGWFTTMYPVKLEVSQDIHTSVSKVQNGLRRVPFNGLGYGILFGYKENKLPRISFNYLGQFEQSGSESEWGFADITGEYALDRAPASETECQNFLYVTAVCFNGQLRFNVESFLGNKTTESFMTSFKESLQEIIENATAIYTRSELKLEHNFEPYFEFHNSGPGSKILFVLPPGEGGAESYFNNIVVSLTQYRLILFNNYYLDNKNTLSTFEELARFYGKYIKRIQPNGPYNFLGWSFGGVLSLEIARQLVLAGENIDNLFFIDSYFNVKKACVEIGRPNERNIIDRINYAYSPNLRDIEKLVASTKNIVLFKAGMMNDSYSTEDQFLLYEYYRRSKFNNLDCLSDSKIQLFNLPDDSHTSWVKNNDLVRDMCNFISSKL